MRRLVHIVVLAALVLSFGKAPFEHAHASDPHHEHANGVSHTHWQSEPNDDGSDAPRCRAQTNSDARMLDWMPGDGRPPVYFAVVLPSSCSPIPAPLTSEFPRHCHGHDPPALNQPHSSRPSSLSPPQAHSSCAFLQPRSKESDSIEVA